MMAGTLVRQQIIDRINKETLIEQADFEKSISPASYELRVGGYHDWSSEEYRALEQDSIVALAPGSFILVGTQERVNLPLDIIGLMYLRSTYARRGYLPWFQGIVDPGYQGKLTIVLHNMTSDVIPLLAGERICHLVFEQLSASAERGYEGSYQDSAGAAPPASRLRFEKTNDFETESGKAVAEQNVPMNELKKLLSNPEIRAALKKLID